jgi:hypothetical protein
VNEMEYIKLKNACSKIGSGSTPKGGASVYIDEGTSLIRSQNVYNLSFSYKGLAYINEEAAQKLRGVTIKKNDILINITGDSVARTCIVPDDVIPARVNQHVAIIRPNNKILNPFYLSYYLASPFMQATMLNHAVGKGASRNAMTKEMIGNYLVPQPCIFIQEKIVGILKNYDNLIENNNKRIKLLEQMAENLYKEWFVRFRLPGYEHVEFENGIPKGWEILRANQLFDITIGKTPDRKIFEYFSNIPECNYPWISISDMRSASTFVFKTKEYLTFNAVNKCNVKIIPKNTVLVSFKLTVGQVAITTSDMCTNEAIAHFITDNTTMREYIYLYLKKFQYSDLGNTSSIGTAVNSKIIKNMKIILPSSELLNRFHDYVYSIFEEIRLLNETNSNLTKQRDMLLPRLMSGKLEV